MNNIYRYSILRLAPDFIRGEIINVGLVLFSSNKPPQVLFRANLKKLQALDVSWSQSKAAEWHSEVQGIVDKSPDMDTCIEALSHMGYCAARTPGLFIANSERELNQELRQICDLYITPKGFIRAEPRKRQPRLINEIRKHFEKMQLLGTSIDDLNQHLVVPNVPVPNHPDLKADFVYKNGVYRITQTLDYRVSAQSAHQKIGEACTKTVAAQLAKKEWGDNTVKLAVVNVPHEVAAIADAHIDMLLTQGFAVFHATDPKDLEKYHMAAIGAPEGDSFVLEQSIRTTQ